MAEHTNTDPDVTLTDKEISEEVFKRLERYFDYTGRALLKVRDGKEKPLDWKVAGDDFLMMAQCYYDDAKAFAMQKKPVLALAALNYAHGWLDAGARIGLFDVAGDNHLFVVDPETGDDHRQ